MSVDIGKAREEINKNLDLTANAIEGHEGEFLNAAWNSFLGLFRSSAYGKEKPVENVQKLDFEHVDISDFQKKIDDNVLYGGNRLLQQNNYVQILKWSKEQVTDIAEKYFGEDSTEEMHNLGYSMLEGLAAGLADSGTSIDWNAILEGMGLSEEILAAFKSCLMIHSPSRLTASLGKDLLEGLNQGIQESLPGYKPNLTGLAGKLEAAFAEELM